MASSAPRLRGVPFTPEVGLDEATALREQREVNAGVRATFSAVHTTVRSQGAAIRGLEELMKRVLPEIDRQTKLAPLKADGAAVERLVDELQRVEEDLRASGARHAALEKALEGKFDLSLGRGALDALTLQQQQFEREAAAREAVGAEVVRLSAGVASFAATLGAVRTEALRDLARLDAVEARLAAADEIRATERTEFDRRLAATADAAAGAREHAELERRVSEGEAAWRRRLAASEAEAQERHAELARAVADRMERDEVS